MVANKIICNSSVLIDLTQDTVIAEKLKYGLTAHDKTGNIITGTCKNMALDPIYYDYNIGYISAGVWIYENPTNTYTDIYQVQAGNQYFFTLGQTVGTRFRAMFTTTDITTVTSGRVTGTQSINTNNPKEYASAKLQCEEDGYLLIAKDNIGNSGLKTYVYDMTEGWI